MKTGRRDFIKKAVFGTFLFLGLGFLVPAVRLLSPVNTRERKLVFFPFVAEDELPRSGVKKAELAVSVAGKERKIRVYLVSSPEGPAVFSATCSHLGCLVHYNKERHEFVCPCHGGRYDLTGKNIAGPPPAPLTRLPLRASDGMLFVGVNV